MNGTSFIFFLFSKIKYPLKLSLSFISVMLFLTSCASKAPQKPIKKTVESTITQIDIEPKVLTAEQVLSEIENLPASATLAQPIALLIKSTELYLQDKNYTKALWLANYTTPLVKNDHAYLYQLGLIKASSLLALNYNKLAYQQLKKIETLSLKTPLTLKYYQLLSEIYQKQDRSVAKLNADLYAFSVNKKASSEDVSSLWQGIQELSLWQLKQLADQKPPYIKGWLQLAKFAHQFGHNQPQLNRYLQQWQRQYSTHPAMSIALQLESANLNNIAIKNIAVILPLSGEKKSAGIAAQQGILAAYNNNETKHLLFIDANQVDWTTLNDTLIEQEVDYVIGPLLKSNVNAYLAALNVITPETQVPSLLLNLPQNKTLISTHVALSMRPEDEANQAASILSQKNYLHPLILSHQDNVSKRIAKTFAKQWQVITGTTVDIVYFDKGKEMQTSLKTSLDVTASQNRIKKLKRKLKYTIKSQSRNRRDIDMIYVVGSSEQTRLVKPYIDVNTSPFASIIPVYASSRSHSTQNTQNSNRDLQGLIFTEIPWLLTSKEQNKRLKQLSDNLWPKRSDSLSQIFAMGFDSYHLINKISLMKQAPYIQHFGQTGALKLNKDNILTRSLLWGKYVNDKVIEIAMD